MVPHVTSSVDESLLLASASKFVRRTHVFRRSTAACAQCAAPVAISNFNRFSFSQSTVPCARENRLIYCALMTVSHDVCGRY